MSSRLLFFVLLVFQEFLELRAVTNTLTHTATLTPTSTPTATPTPTPTATPTSTPTATATPTPTNTPTPSPTATPTPSPTGTPTPSPTGTPTASPTPTPTSSPTPTPSASPTSSPTPTPTGTPTPTPTSTPTPTPTYTQSVIVTHTPTLTPSQTPTSTPSPTPSSTPTSTPSPTPSSSPTTTPTPTPTPTQTPSSTSSPTPTHTPTLTVSVTPITSLLGFITCDRCIMFNRGSLGIDTMSCSYAVPLMLFQNSSFVPQLVISPANSLNVILNQKTDNSTWSFVVSPAQTGVIGTIFFKVPFLSRPTSPTIFFETAQVPVCLGSPYNDTVCAAGIVCDGSQYYNGSVCLCQSGQSCLNSQCTQTITGAASCFVGATISAGTNVVMATCPNSAPLTLTIPNLAALTFLALCTDVLGCAYTLQRVAGATISSASMIFVVQGSASPATNPVNVTLTNNWPKASFTLSNVATFIVSSGITLTQDTFTASTPTNCSLTSNTLNNVTLISGKGGETTTITSPTLLGTNIVSSSYVVLAGTVNLATTVVIYIFAVTMSSMSNADITGYGIIYIRGYAQMYNPFNKRRIFRAMNSPTSVPGSSLATRPLHFDRMGVEATTDVIAPCGASPDITVSSFLELSLVCASGGGPMTANLLTLGAGAQINVLEANSQTSTNPSPTVQSCSWTTYSVNFQQTITSTVNKNIRIVLCNSLANAQTLPTSITGCGSCGCTASFISNTLVISLTCVTTTTTTSSTSTSTTSTTSTTSSTTTLPTPVTSSSSSGTAIAIGVGVGVGGAFAIVLIGLAVYFLCIKAPVVEQPELEYAVQDAVPPYPKFPPQQGYQVVSYPASSVPQQVLVPSVYAPTPSPTPYLTS